VLCFLWGTNWIYICYVEESRPPLWSSGQSSWLQNGDVLCIIRYSFYWNVCMSNIHVKEIHQFIIICKMYDHFSCRKHLVALAYLYQHFTATTYYGLVILQEYLKSDPTDRSHELTLIFTLKQGHEPVSFTSLFPSWDASLWEVCEP
jgi:hypothetical protein